jgi:hypothetical protein
VAGRVTLLQLITAFKYRLTVTKGIECWKIRNENTKYTKKAEISRYTLGYSDKSRGFINGMNAVIFSSDYKLFKFSFITQTAQGIKYEI